MLPSTIYKQPTEIIPVSFHAYVPLTVELIESQEAQFLWILLVFQLHPRWIMKKTLYMYLLLIQINPGNCLDETANRLQSTKIGTHKIFLKWLHTIQHNCVFLEEIFQYYFTSKKHCSLENLCFLLCITHNTDSFTNDIPVRIWIHAN